MSEENWVSRLRDTQKDIPVNNRVAASHGTKQDGLESFGFGE